MQGRYLDAIRLFSADEKPDLLSGDVRRQLTGPDPERLLSRHFERFAHLPWASQMMRFDMETYLPEDILTKVDRMSMAHSIESRVPLLDNEVLAFACSAAGGAEDQERPPKARPEGGRRDAAADGDHRPAEAGLRRADRRLVPRQPARAVRRHAAVAAQRCSAATSSRRSCGCSWTSTSPASAITRCGSGSSSCSSGGIKPTSTAALPARPLETPSRCHTVNRRFHSARAGSRVEGRNRPIY